MAAVHIYGMHNLSKSRCIINLLLLLPACEPYHRTVEDIEQMAKEGWTESMYANPTFLPLKTLTTERNYTQVISQSLEHNSICNLKKMDFTYLICGYNPYFQERTYVVND